MFVPIRLIFKVGPGWGPFSAWNYWPLFFGSPGPPPPDPDLFVKTLFPGLRDGVIPSTPQRVRHDQAPTMSQGVPGRRGTSQIFSLQQLRCCSQLLSLQKTSTLQNRMFVCVLFPHASTHLLKAPKGYSRRLRGFDPKPSLVLGHDVAPDADAPRRAADQNGDTTQLAKPPGWGTILAIKWCTPNQAFS